MQTKLSLVGGIALALTAAVGCGPSVNIPGTEFYLEAPDGDDHGLMSQLVVRPSEITIEIAEGQKLTAHGVFEDGYEMPIAQYVTWEAGEMVGSSNDSGDLTVTGRTEGTQAVTIKFGSLVGQATVTIVPASLREIAMTNAEETVVPRGGVLQLGLSGTYGDGHTEDLTAQATWTSSDEAIAIVQNDEKAGQVSAIATGPVQITAVVEEFTQTHDITVECVYPDAPSTLSDGGVLPNLSWDNLYLPGGSRGSFGFENFHCGQDFEDKQAIIMLVSTGWCPYCPAYMDRINSQATQLENAGATIMFAEAEDAQGQPCDTDYAQGHIGSIIGDATGYRFGDLDTLPTANAIRRSPVIQAFPSVFVFRKADMRLVANQSNANNYLDLLEIVEKIDWDWSDPDNPVPGFTSRCVDGQDESYEPNDSPAQASTIGATSVSGGICTEAPDFYRIDIEGEWRVTLEFDNSVGNLDVVVWNETTGRPLTVGGQPVGSTSTDADFEVFRHTGPSLIKVEGARAASAPYTLFVEAL